MSTKTFHFFSICFLENHAAAFPIVVLKEKSLWVTDLLSELLFSVLCTCSISWPEVDFLSGWHMQYGGNKALESPVMCKFTFPCMSRWSEPKTSSGSNRWQIVLSRVLPWYAVLLTLQAAIQPQQAWQNCYHGLLLWRLCQGINHHGWALIHWQHL